MQVQGLIDKQRTWYLCDPAEGKQGLAKSGFRAPDRIQGALSNLKVHLDVNIWECWVKGARDLSVHFFVPSYEFIMTSK